MIFFVTILYEEAGMWVPFLSSVGIVIFIKILEHGRSGNAR